MKHYHHYLLIYQYYINNCYAKEQCGYWKVKNVHVNKTVDSVK